MLNVIWGSNKDKPQAAKALAELLSSDAFHGDGYLYIGYPVIGSPLGPVKLDALLISPQYGLVAFDLIEGIDVDGFRERLDEIASMLEVKLKPYPSLKSGRNLLFDINTVTFAPAKTKLPDSEGPYICTNKTNLLAEIEKFEKIDDGDVFSNLLAAIQVVTQIRSSKNKRSPSKPKSKLAKLKDLDNSIANLDQHQSRAVIETVEGIQRIRGLAGSGKTIVLALKVAYLHAQNPDWKIAVTFNTRSLKEQFKRLINSFTIEQTSSEPDWERIDIINAWGGPGGKEQDGVYHKFCRVHQISFHDFDLGKAKAGSGDKAFQYVCAEALNSVTDFIETYDLILVDEAQDFPPEFLNLCFKFLKEPKRLVYAYDELQSLTGNSVSPPEVIFGVDKKGRPNAKFDASENAIPRQDIILEKCYRNSAPILTTAHALGFGIYRSSGLVQFFDQDSLWKDVGYVVEDGDLKADTVVTLARTSESSPEFLQNHSNINDLIQFVSFSTNKEQVEWLVESIKNDIFEEELRPEDIVVINPDPATTREAVSRARSMLLRDGINNELAGVSTSRDIFSHEGSVTFTGVFRAKGNEAGMVYVINAHDCYSSLSKLVLAQKRNRLFTAITRSKAWVRVIGVGPKMDALIEEWNHLKDNDFKLKFKYPNESQKQDLRLINVEEPKKVRAREKELERNKNSLLNAVIAGELDVKQLIEDLKKFEESKKQ